MGGQPNLISMKDPVLRDRHGWIDLLSMAMVLSALVITAEGAATAKQPGETQPDLTDQQKEEFLLDAKILGRKTLSLGVTRSERVTLSDGKLTHDAHLQTVDVFKRMFKSERRVEMNFRDSYKFNIAAYRLDRLLGLNMVPVSVERKIGEDLAALTWWIDDYQMMEKDRIKGKVAVPNPSLWNDQMYQVRIFNQLVYNTDPNLGNLLITTHWKIRLIDFTRAFRLHKKLENPKDLIKIDRRLYNGLRSLNHETLSEKLAPCLTKNQMKSVWARRERLVQHFENKIAAKGEAAVICDAPGH